MRFSSNNLEIEDFPSIENFESRNKNRIYPISDTPIIFQSLEIRGSKSSDDGNGIKNKEMASPSDNSENIIVQNDNKYVNLSLKRMTDFKRSKFLKVDLESKKKNDRKSREITLTGQPQFNIQFFLLIIRI